MTDCGQLCVCTHSANGKVFYVGHGMLGRAYDRHSRTPCWKDYVKKVGAFETVIQMQTDDRVEAQKIEAELIAAHKPFCNGRKVPGRPKTVTIPFAVRLKPDAHTALIEAGAAEERPAAWVAQRAIIQWLKESGWLK
jgi:hypothetical protein